MSVTDSISTPRLKLDPLVVADAVEMVGVLSDPALYTFTGGEQPTLDQLDERYLYQSAGSANEAETWHNWILRLDDTAIGYVQATVTGDCADLAWVVGVPWQGSGYATEASTAIRDWLAERGTVRFSAHIHPEHTASQVVASRLGLTPTGGFDDDGEMIWG